MNDKNCIFCLEKADTKEHIPAKQLFKGISGKNLITVPSCKKCNSGFQKDEDFFRQFWVSFFIERSTEAKRLMENEVSRSIKRKPALGWQMFKQMKPVNRFSKTGEYLGKATLINITEFDRARINRVVDKVIRGLFFQEFKQTVPKNWSITIHWITPKMEQEQKLQEMTKTMNCRVTKEDTFAYFFDFIPNDYQSIWILDLFRIPLFYVFVRDTI
ncbi:MAG: hypothetical protein V4721_06515 [Bacteroidota bacterium]